MQLPGFILFNGVLWVLALGTGIVLPVYVFIPVVLASGFISIGFSSRHIRSMYASVSDSAGMQEDTAGAEETDIPDVRIAPENYAAPVEQTVDNRQLTNDISSLLDNLQKALRDQSVHDLSRVEQVRHLTDSELRPRLEHLKTDTTQILDNVSRAFDISDNLSKTANDTFALAAKVQKGIENINEILRQSLQNTQFLEEQSKKISRILDLMSDISSQIQVLSMNASIVSARAGVHGKGFEVVAKEIRTLSHQTEDSLQEIAASIGEIQQTIRMVGEDTQQADEAAAEETKSLMSVAGSLQGVQLAIEVVHTVSETSKEKISRQTRQLTEIGELYNQLDTLVHELQAIESTQGEQVQTAAAIDAIRTRLQSEE
ncbi:MAG: methyl-accepting chemotaxis protein [Spirochaeta sp.]